MSNRDTGGPAFPAPYEFASQNDMGRIFCSEGMTLWDYFAAAALASGNDTWVAAEKADAMLAERAKRQGGGDG